MAVEDKVSDEKCNEEGKDWPQIVAVLSGCLSPLSSGLLIAWTSPFLLKITKDKENYDVTEDQGSYFALLSTVGICLLSPFVLSIPDTIGRKNTLLLTAIPHMATWVIKALSRNLYAIYFARFCVGFGDALQFSSLPMYLGEITTPRVRGVWGNGMICSLFLGQFLINVIGAYFTVQETALLCLTVPVVFLMTFSFMPESPYFYIMKKRDEEAKEALRRLRRVKDVEHEFDQLKSAVYRQMSESGTWTDLLKIRSNRRALIAAVFLRMAQLYSGLFAFAAFTQYIFEKSGGKVNSEISAMIYMGFAFVLFSSAAYFSNKLGRRNSFIISTSLASVLLTLEGVYFYIDRYQPEIDLEMFTWFPLVGMIIFVIVCSFGVVIIPTLMLGELFSVSVKAKGVCVVTTLFGLMTLFTNVLFYNINLYTGLCGPFFLFGVCTAVSAILSYYLVPETKGKTLEDIQLTLKQLN
ncbi:unnamed protein product [Phaedon cochleariae]|uniref:Major facilitator superfamily (MFS) profile domain-containing protein n=1 Tax=Phaedon cochleariae TaxID=80249 RepID=A0A9P0DJB9_PHACE|nr:unnamed protein product [Phaedon cochleariae]